MKHHKGLFAQHGNEASNCFGKCYLAPTKLYAEFLSFQKDCCCSSERLHIGHSPTTQSITSVALSHGLYLISQWKLQAKGI